MPDSKTWFFEDLQGVKLIRFVHLSKYPELIHFVTTRIGGVSKDQSFSMNIGFVYHDNPENVIENRKILAKVLQIPFDSFVFERQIHSDNTIIISKNDKGRGTLLKSDAIQDNDGFIVHEPDVCPVAMHADCTPVILYDPVKKVAAAIHAGWRGTLKLIARKGVEKMVREFGTNPADVLAGIGPSNGPCCYEVGDEVILEVKKVFSEHYFELLLPKVNAKSHFDQWQANKIQLMDAGLIEENIKICDCCVFHHPELFFSSRYNNRVTGRMGAGVMIRK
jgi:polyphenol oxidase